jgi:hypothetical protein
MLVEPNKEIVRVNWKNCPHRRGVSHVVLRAVTCPRLGERRTLAVVHIMTAFFSRLIESACQFGFARLQERRESSFSHQ